MALNKFIKSTGIYFMGNVLSKIVVFLLLPVYTSYISPESMGLYDTGVTVITLFASMLFLDIGSVILKFSLEKECDNESFPITNGSLIFIASCVIYFTLVTVCSFFFRYEYMGWIIIYGFTYAFNNAVGYVARALHHNTDYAIAGVIQTILMVVINIILLVGLGVDYKSLYIAYVVSSMITSAYLIFRVHVFKFLRKRFIDKVKFSQMFRFALPLCVNSVAFWLLSSSGRIIVTYMLGASATGFLSIGNKFTQILYLVSNCVHLTWQEVAFTHDNSDESEKGFYSKTFIIYYKIVMFCVAGLILGIKIGLFIFPGFIDSSYSFSVNLIPSALIGTGLAIVSQFLGTIFSSLKKTTVVFLSTLVGAVTTVSTTFLFIGLGCGAASANYSFIAGYMITITVRLILLRRFIGMSARLQNLLWIVPVLILTVYTYIDFSVIFSVILLIILMGMLPILFKNELKACGGKFNGRNR